MTTHLENEVTTFYEQLQNCEELDLRDNRGKNLNMSFNLLGLTIGLLRKRDGYLSSIHRSMQNKNAELCLFLGIENEGVVSRSHLPLLLQKVNLKSFEKLLFDNYGIVLKEKEKEWFSGDGKELRGSIEKGSKRGEAIVHLVRHKDREVLGQTFYNGKKESEKPSLRKLIASTNASSQKITADALHLNPLTTEMMAEDGGVFLIGLKKNQKELYEDMVKSSAYLKPVNQDVTIEKGHGRVERRSYFHYDIKEEYFDERWNKTNFQSLFKVERERWIGNTGKESTETDYYISNGPQDENEDYFTAIREHWSVEVCNHIRDVTFQEDKLKTKKKSVTKILAGFRTLAIKLLGIIKPKNMIAQLELFQDDFLKLLQWLKTIKFL